VLRNSPIVTLVSKIQYPGLVLERHTLHHYKGRIWLSNLESGDLIL